MAVRVGVVDSGLGADSAVAAGAAFALTADGTVAAGPTRADALGHGAAVAALIRAQAPACRLLDAQVFADAGAAAPAVVAAAIDWCVAHGARVINLSLGLRDDRQVLHAACDRALAAEVLLVASTPARGDAVYPAAYAGVVAVCGDARCAPAGWSLLDDRRRVGASPAAPAGAPAGLQSGGASYAAARISGIAAAFFARYPEAAVSDFIGFLLAGAAYHGREARRAVA